MALDLNESKSSLFWPSIWSGFSSKSEALQLPMLLFWSLSSRVSLLNESKAPKPPKSSLSFSWLDIGLGSESTLPVLSSFSLWFTSNAPKSPKSLSMSLSCIDDAFATKGSLLTFDSVSLASTVMESLDVSSCLPCFFSKEPKSPKSSSSSSL